MSQQSGGWQATFERDVMGLETERHLPGGIQSQWKRDGLGRPLWHRVEGGGRLYATTHRQQNYEWGLHHRLKALTDPLGGMMQFEHDALGNLTKTLFGDGQQQLRNPDKTGNLFESLDQKDRQYDKGGKLLQSKGFSYKYDGEGNLIEKKGKDGKVWKYEWNGAGMLAKVTRPDREEVSFGYDALGRRVWKRYGNTITKWVWDGDKPLHEWKEHALTGAILSDTKVGSDGIITWLFEENSFAPVAKLKGEKKYSIITDHLGTPAQMYTEEGKLCWQGALDSYGRMRMEKGETGSCPFRYQGQYEDKEIGLYYNRFRYYSPEEGIYLSQDPIRLEGGSKFYGYVHDPNSWIDPFGLNNVSTGAGRTHVKYSGIKNGKPYHGYASAPTSDNLKPEEIVSRRYGSNFDEFDVAPKVDYTGKNEIGKQTARGLEQRGFEADGGLKGTSNAQNPVGPNNENRQKYLDAADAHLKTKVGC